MQNTELDYTNNDNSLPGGNIQNWVDDGNYRPQFRAHHRHTNAIVGILADEVGEVLKQVPPGQANITMRTVLCDAVAQTAFAIDRVKCVADVRHVARKLDEVLQFAYKFAEIQPTVPSKTLIALFRIAKLMVKRHNSGV